MLKKLAALAVMSGFVLGLAACNTVEGAGKDVRLNNRHQAADKNKSNSGRPYDPFHATLPHPYGVSSRRSTANVDTGAIIRQFRSRSSGRALAEPVRRMALLDHGEPGVDNAKRPRNPISC